MTLFRDYYLPNTLILSIAGCILFWSLLAKCAVGGNATDDCRGPNDPNNMGHRRRLKVLLVPIGLSWSHQQFMGRIGDTLAEAGHEVHFLRVSMGKNNFDLMPRVTKFGHKLHNISTENVSNPKTKLPLYNEPFRGNAFPTFLFQSNFWQNLFHYQTALCEEIIGRKDLIVRLEAEHFDVGISEHYSLCPFGLFHRVGIPTKLTTVATPLFQMALSPFGIPAMSSFVTNMHAVMRNTPQMTFWERTVNLYNDLYERFYLKKLYFRMQQTLFDRLCGPNFPSLEQIEKNISLILVNSIQFFEFPQPVSNKVIHIGGLVEMESKELEPNVKRILDNSSGAVLISFGALADMRKMGAELKTNLLKAFARFPRHEFVWKYGIVEGNDTELFNGFPNVHAVEWVDQKSVLLHPKIRAFVSHCGQNGISEAARAGVPILAIPLFADQLYNALLAHHKGMSVQLNIEELHHNGTVGQIVEALEKYERPKERLLDHLQQEEGVLSSRTWSPVRFGSIGRMPSC